VLISRAMSRIDARQPSAPAPTAEEIPLHGFLTLFKPQLDEARQALRREIEARGAGAPFADSAAAERALFASFPLTLLARVDRTLVLELNVARLQGRLSGATPEERFASFVDLLGKPEMAKQLLDEYPVLAEGVATTIAAWFAASLELYERLTGDWEELRRLFFPQADPGPVVEVRVGMGDPHRRGRSVAILRFESGARLVYKPRPVAVDLHFQDLLAWLRGRGAPAHRTLRVLDRVEYGWVEFVEAAPCDTPDQVERYHHRLGSLLAVLYAFGGVDVHFENLIASGDQPVAIDLESLLHPPPHRSPSERSDERLLGKALTESVLRVGLLPFQIRDAAGDEADLSGMAAVGGALSRDPVLQWEGIGGDEMRVVQKRMPMPAGHNRATLDGQEVDAAQHVAAIADGFASTYRLIVRERDAVLAPGGPLSWFIEDATRIVLRATRAYGLLLEGAWHPDYQRAFVERDRFLDRLSVGVEQLVGLERVITYEHRDLARGDIPYFSALAGSRDLWASEGDLVEGHFDTAPLDVVRRRIEAMDEDDLRRQGWLVRTSLGTLLLNQKEGEWPEYSLADPGEPRDPADLRKALIGEARLLGDWFERMAIRDGEDLTWVTLDLREGTWALYPCSEDLYAGVPGISFFLGYLASVTGEERYAAVARAGLWTLLRRIPHTAEAIRTIGLYQGWGGIIYTLTHLGRVLGDRALLEEAERLVEQIESRLEGDAELDVVGGAAGAVTGLLALYSATGSSRALAAARRCGEQLLAAARPAGAGIGWPIRIAGDEPQAGFAHGAAGIATSLVALADATRDERFRDAARAAFHFERERLWPQLDRWIAEDEAGAAGGSGAATATRQAERDLPMSWCYGAPGIALSRLRLLRGGGGGDDGARDRDASAHDDLVRAAMLTLDRGFGTNHCLCHGDLGNLDVLAQAAPLIRDERLDAGIAPLTRAILAAIRDEGWRPGTVAGVESPGLMNGLAGIGLGLLRMAAPDCVPSVLGMDPPPAATPAPPAAPAPLPRKGA